MGQPNDEVANEIIINEILNEVREEIKRQLELWGVAFDDLNTANDWVAYICRYVAAGAYDGRVQAYDSEKFEEYLKKAAGICISAIAAIKRNGDCAPRHYD